MSDIPASIYQTVQLAVEAPPGTAVAATKKLQSMAIEPSIKVDTKKFRPAGNKFPSLVVPGKEWAAAKVSGLATYTEIVYALASVVGYTAPAQQGGTTAYLWDFTVRNARPDVNKTFTVEHGYWTRARRMTNFLFTSFGLDYSRDAIEISGDAIGDAVIEDIHLSTNATYTLTAGGTPPTSGTFTLTFGGQTTAGIQYNATAAAVETALEALSTIGAGNVEVTATVAEGAGNLSVAANVYTVEFVNELAQAPRTLTGTFTSLDPSGSITLAAGVVGVTPTEIELVPVLPTQVDLYVVRTAQSDLDAANAMTGVLSYSWNIADRFAPFWPLGTANGLGFAGTVETEPNVTVKLKLAADDEGMAFLADVRAGDTLWMRNEAVGEVIVDPYYYKLTIDTALKVLNVNDFSDEDGVYAVEYEMAVVYDSVWGKALDIQVINKLTTL